MKTNKYIIIVMAMVFGTTFFVSCNSDDNDAATAPALDFTGTYMLQDQMARPAINTVFIAAGEAKNTFNNAIPSAMGAAYQGIFMSRLLALNAEYSTNALGQTATQLSTLLSTDVLNVSKTGITSFFDGTNVLTGRALGDDVINTELLLIFGGPDGTEKPGLTNDHVDSNDKPFLASFPYLAVAW